jgi:hypothetical protein
MDESAELLLMLVDEVYLWLGTWLQQGCGTIETLTDSGRGRRDAAIKQCGSWEIKHSQAT